MLTVINGKELSFQLVKVTHSCAASQLAVGFRDIGPAPRNPQLILNKLAFVGAWLQYPNANQLTQPSIADYHQLAPCPEGTRIYKKPTASSGGAQLWDKHPLTISWFRKAGLTILGCVSPPFGELLW